MIDDCKTEGTYTAPEGATAGAAPTVASVEATIPTPPTLSSAPEELASHLRAEVSGSDSGALQQRDSVTLAPDAPYLYAKLDDKTFHATLSGFVERGKEQYAACGLTLYYGILPGLQDAQRRFTEHADDPDYRLDGCKGIEEYIKQLGLKPATIRKWRQRENERQAMREIKLLVGKTGACPECGRAKGHVQSSPQGERPLTPTQESVVQALVDQGFQKKEAVTMVKGAQGDDIGSLLRSALAHHASRVAGGTTVIDAEQPQEDAKPDDEAVAAAPDSKPVAEDVAEDNEQEADQPDADVSDTARQHDDDEDPFALLKQQADTLKAALAVEPDTDVASKMLTEYLQTVASLFAGERIIVRSFSAWVEFVGRDHRIMPGDYLERRKLGLRPDEKPVLVKCVGIAEFMRRRKVREWNGQKWGKEQVVFSQHEHEYRVISEKVARNLEPRAFDPPSND